MQEIDTVDYWVMLFSADWFVPHWRASGVQADSQEQRKFQASCRDLVRWIVGDAENYWQTSFDDARINETKNRLIRAAERAIREQDSVARIRRLISHQESSETDERIVRTIVSLNNWVTSSRPSPNPKLQSELADRVRTTWDRFKPVQRDFEKDSIESPSSWDSYLRTLTPELPTRLPDFISNLANLSIDVRGFWQQLAKQTTPQQRDELRAWYHQAAREELGEDFPDPGWMMQH